MLGKLIKYDVKAMGKIIVPFWIVLLIAGWFLSIRLRFGDVTSSNTLDVIAILVCVMVVTAVFVMTVVIIIQRFWKGLLKEEGYLMFTLPVSARSLILSKMLSALLISLGTIAVLILMFLPLVFIQNVHVSWKVLLNALDINVWKSLGYGIALGLAELVSSIYHMYASMALGQLSNRNRFALSVARYILITIVLGIISVPIMDMVNEDMMNVLLLAGAVLEVIVFHVVTEYILSKKLNLE